MISLSNDYLIVGYVLRVSLFSKDKSLHSSSKSSLRKVFHFCFLIGLLS